MAAARHDLTIEQGATFSSALTFTDNNGDAIDITGWTFTGQIRATYSSATVLKAFTFSAGSTTNQKLFSISAADTSSLAVELATNFRLKNTYYIYDIQAVRGDGTVLRIIEGSAIVVPAVTRS